MKYKLLPHYKLNDAGLTFLYRQNLELESECLEAVQAICQQKEPNEDVSLSKLLNDSVIVEDIPRKIRSKKRNVIVAAHSDDAALSLGGYILSSDQQFSILNVFSSCPTSVMLNGLLNTAGEVTFYNNLEEEFYAKLVDAELKFLGFPEALERGYENAFEVRDVSEDPAFTDVENSLLNCFSLLDSDKIFFPVSIGNQIDHVMLYNIGKKLVETGWDIDFYEDLPYTKELSEKELELQLNNKTKGMSSELIDISGFIDRKVSLAAIYKTQYDQRYLQRLSDYAWEIGNNRPVERIWRFEK